MAIHLIIYLLCAVGIFVMNVINNSYMPYVVDCVFIIVSALMLAAAIVLRHGVKVGFSEEHMIARRGEKCTLKIAITNNTVLPLTYCAVKLRIYTQGDKRKVRKRPIKRIVRGMCPPRGRDFCEISVKCPHCETVKVKILKAYPFDFLRIFSFGQKVLSTCDVIVEPKLPDIELIEKMSAEIGEGENELYSPNRPGDDPTEIFAIREYKGGDKIRNIHWKLSSKMSGLMVKDYGFPLRDNDTVVIDIFSGGLSENKYRNMRDSLFDLFYGLIHAMTKRGVGFTVCYYDQSYRAERIETQTDIYNLFVHLYGIKPYENDVSCAQLFYVQNDGNVKRRIYYVTPFYDKNAIGNMHILSEMGVVYYLIPGEVKDSRMPVRFRA